MLVRELREEALDEDLLLLREEVRGDGAEDPSGFGAVSIPAGVQTWSRIRTEGGRTHLQGDVGPLDPRGTSGSSGCRHARGWDREWEDIGGVLTCGRAGDSRGCCSGRDPLTEPRL
jgi:hypothetical protein